MQIFADISEFQVRDHLEVMKLSSNCFLYVILDEEMRNFERVPDFDHRLMSREDLVSTRIEETTAAKDDRQRKFLRFHLPATADEVSRRRKSSFTPLYAAEFGEERSQPVSQNVIPTRNIEAEREVLQQNLTANPLLTADAAVLSTPKNPMKRVS